MKLTPVVYLIEPVTETGHRIVSISVGSGVLGSIKEYKWVIESYGPIWMTTQGTYTHDGLWCKDLAKFDTPEEALKFFEEYTDKKNAKTEEEQLLDSICENLMADPAFTEQLRHIYNLSTQKNDN